MFLKYDHVEKYILKDLRIDYSITALTDIIMKTKRRNTVLSAVKNPYINLFFIHLRNMFRSFPNSYKLREREREKKMRMEMVGGCVLKLTCKIASYFLSRYE